MGDTDAGNALRAFLRDRLVLTSGPQHSAASSAQVSPCEADQLKAEQPVVEPVLAGVTSRGDVLESDRSATSAGEDLCGVSQRNPDDATLVDLSLSDSDPSSSPVRPPSIDHFASSTEVGAGQTGPASASREGASGIFAVAYPETRGVATQAAPVVPFYEFAWFQGLPREIRRQLRSCQTVEDARRTLANVLADTDADGAFAPAGLVEALQQKTRTLRRRTLELEEELQKQNETHDAELAAIHQEHRRSQRKAKLDLLAQLAPQHPGALDALSRASSLASTPAKSRAVDLERSLTSCEATPSRIGMARTSVTSGRCTGSRRAHSCSRLGDEIASAAVKSYCGACDTRPRVQAHRISKRPPREAE